TTWCPDCRRAKRFLRERQIAFEEINIEEVPAAAELVVQRNHGLRKVPTFDHEGRFFACSPFDPRLLQHELGLTIPVAELGSWHEENCKD
ncbi:MAG: glutaredoxin family protein, partial [Terriglobales bacterium]